MQQSGYVRGMQVGTCRPVQAGRSGPAASRAAAVSLACIFFVRCTQMICVAGLSLFTIIMLPISKSAAEADAAPEGLPGFDSNSVQMPDRGLRL